MVENEILSPGDSDTVSLVFFVTKKQNKDKTAVSGRLVFDYRRLNEKIKGMNFPLTPIKNFFDQASQYSCFAAIDIRNAFLTVSMTERAKKRCGIITPFGVFIPQRMPFGLKTYPAGFCYVMHLILSGLAFAQYYMDDIIVGGKDEAELTKNLITVFEKLNAGNLKIQLSKVQFFESELKLLGVVFSKAGKKIDPVKVQTITECPEPKTVKQLQQF